MMAINATGTPVWAQILIIPIALIALSIARHIIQQLLFPNKDEPPLVFSWLPLIGSTIDYGVDPYKFYFKYQKEVSTVFFLTFHTIGINVCQYGNIFSFVLVGKKHTVCLGLEGNNFVLNGSVGEISAADIYRGLTLPIFGKDVCYDCSPAKLMEQKKVRWPFNGQGITFLTSYSF
jgi:sterol 14-demethylase